MKVCVAGVGYVGLVVGTCLAYLGHDVICFDKDEKKIRDLEQGQVPIYEPGLAGLIEQTDNLQVTTNGAWAISQSTVMVIAVGTPPQPDGSADLSAIYAVAELIARYASQPFYVIIKSTVPIGTAYRVRALIEGITDIPFDVISNPEFLREGDAVGDFMRPARIVVGYQKETSRDVIEMLYEPFLKNTPIYYMDNQSAEITKYASNTMLAIKTSFINEIALLCESADADVESVAAAVGADPRIVRPGLYAGVGYGGSCFPKDVACLLKTSKDLGVDMSVAKAAHARNVKQKVRLVEKLAEHIAISSSRHIAVWGLAFKPGTDDVRRASSLDTVRRLLELGATVSAFDPRAMATAQQKLGDTITYAPDALSALDGADALLLVTEWDEFRDVNWFEAASRMRGRLILDGRNLWNPATVKAAGFEYRGIGRS